MTGTSSALPHRRRPSAALLVAALATALATGPLLAGCARSVAVDAAPDGSAALCAEVYTALPDVVAGLERVPTTAQGAAAWTGPADAGGGGTATVVLRCGVEPPGPTTDPCQEVEGGGVVVQWVVGGTADGRTTWTTYGRSPAVSLQMPVDTTTTTAAPIDVAPAVALVPQSRTCD